MRATTKNKKAVVSKKTSGVIDPAVGNYEKHPYFVKKANEAKHFLKTAGLPKKWVRTK